MLIKFVLSHSESDIIISNTHFNKIECNYHHSAAHAPDLTCLDCVQDLFLSQIGKNQRSNYVFSATFVRQKFQFT